MQSILGGPFHTYHRPRNASDPDLRRTTNLDADVQGFLVKCFEYECMYMIPTTPDGFYEIVEKIQ